MVRNDPRPLEVSAAPSRELSFEAAFAQLEETVQLLETGNLPLQQMVELFERGVHLSDACAELLKAAELRVSQLTPAPRSLDGLGFGLTDEED
ncbi:MAG: exodeoxyribonuclease VII small subunit [Chloroflexi bacterium]|nr:exodeoxyribonuclease VII small subunit [Chloroflexota bacterium]